MSDIHIPMEAVFYRPLLVGLVVVVVVIGAAAALAIWLKRK